VTGGHDGADTELLDGRSGPISAHGLINFIHGHLIELVTVVYLSYIVLGTLIPFDFSWSAAFGQKRSLLGLGRHQSGVPDLLSNVGLYLPLGALLYWSLTRCVGFRWLSVVVSVGVAGVLSLTIESIQLLSPTRVSSAVDFAANLVGAASGAGLARACRGPDRHVLTALSRELRVDARSAVLKIYIGLLAVGALAPFTPTIDVSRLRGSIRDSTLVPFAQSGTLAARAGDAASLGDLDAAADYQRRRMHLWLRWSAEFLSFALLGLLLHRVLGQQYQFKPATALALTVYLVTLLAVTLSALQLVVLSRGSHVTDILIRVVGAVAGYLTLPGLWTRLRAGGADTTAAMTLLAKPLLVTAVVAVMFNGLAPFVVDFDLSRAAERATSSQVLPFYSYYMGRFDRVCADFWGKSLCWGFLGVAMWMCWAGRPSCSLRGATLSVVGTALLLSATVEASQLFLRSRVASLTDIIIAPLAAWIAAILAQYAADFCGGAVRSLHRPVAAEQPHEVRWSLTDALVGTLIPDPPPREPVPGPLEQPQQPNDG